MEWRRKLSVTLYCFFFSYLPALQKGGLIPLARMGFLATIISTAGGNQLFIGHIPELGVSPVYQFLDQNILNRPLKMAAL